MTEVDFLIVGGGIAGVSSAYELAAFGRVRVLERESHLGYHSTGRSAALYTESYGNAVVRRLTRASGPFFRAPPPGFAEFPILQQRGTLLIAREDQLETLRSEYEELRTTGVAVNFVDGPAAVGLVPALRPEYVRGAIYESAAQDVDVELLLRGYVRGLKARGGEIVQAAGVNRLEYRAGLWHVFTEQGEHTAPIVVNASGAWADEVAALAGVPQLGLVPKRRTALTVAPIPHEDVRHWPAVIDIDEEFYFKPEGGNVLFSPADETPSAPCDAMPDEWDVAVAIDRVQRATDFAVPRIIRQWAGLRTFVADRALVIGYEPQASGFFWLAAQGGYGIQTSAAAARATAALVTRQAWPADLAALGLQPEHLAPERLKT